MSVDCTEYMCGGIVKEEGYSGKIRRFIELSARVANQSESPDYRHGATLVKGASVINTSFNKNNFCSFGHRFRKKEHGNAKVHAEIGAILGIERKNTEGATIYVASHVLCCDEARGY